MSLGREVEIWETYPQRGVCQAVVSVGDASWRQVPSALPQEWRFVTRNTQVASWRHNYLWGY